MLKHNLRMSDKQLMAPVDHGWFVLGHKMAPSDRARAHRAQPAA
jgi:hypothetical protein